MFQLDNNFLQEVGLGDLPDDQKKTFLEYFREQLEVRVGTQLSNGLSDQQLDEFESFMNRDMEKVNGWIAMNAPGYQEDTVFQQLSGGAPSDISQDVILAEYASLKWLGLNRPDYRQVVANVMEELKQETISNRDAILESVNGQD